MPLRVSHRVFTVDEAVQQILDSENEVENVVIIPPSNVGYVTDEEEENGLDDALPNDVAGELEVNFRLPDTEEEDVDVVLADDNLPGPSSGRAEAPKAKRTKKAVTQKVNWKKSCDTFSNDLPRCEIPHLFEQRPDLEEKSPYELFQLFLTTEILHDIFIQTNIYAGECICFYSL